MTYINDDEEPLVIISIGDIIELKDNYKFLCFGEDYNGKWKFLVKKRDIIFKRI